MSPVRVSVTLHYETSPQETRKKQLNDSVFPWDININDSLVSGIMQGIDKGYEYLNSTYALLGSIIHGTYSLRLVTICCVYKN